MTTRRQTSSGNNPSSSSTIEENDCREKGRDSPPGSAFARFIKQFWYLVVCGSCIALIDLIKDMFIQTPQIDIANLDKRTNQVAVMTGSARGIGFNILKKLLQLDYTVILGVRNIAKSEEGISSIRQLGIESGRVKLFQLDLKSLKSVKRFASNVLSSSEGKRIDLLLNNAGIMNVPYEKTEDNFESQFQVNYLSHFLLTNLLLPRITETSLGKDDPCQIVNTSSHSQKGGRIDFDELETSKVYSAVKCYFDSKLCQVIHVKTLEKMFREDRVNIHAYAVHPGEIPTDLWSDLGVLARFFRPIIKYFCRTTDGAANTVLYPVFTAGVLQNGGQYFESGKIKPANPQADDPEIQDRLWKRSLQLTLQSPSSNN